MMTFHSKPDKSHLVMIFFSICCLTLLVTAAVLWPLPISSTWRIFILVIGFFVITFFAYFHLVIRYTLTADALVACAGPFKKRIAYEDILFIHETSHKHRRHRMANATETLTLYAINRQNTRALTTAQAYATQQGVSLNRSLVRFIAEPNNRAHYMNEGFDPRALRLLTISPHEKHLFITELLQYLEKYRT